MPIEFEIDTEIDAIVLRLTGTVNAQDFVRSTEAVVHLPGFQPGMNQLLDVCHGTLDLDLSDSRNLARFFQSAPVRQKLGSGYRLALVSQRPPNFAALRVFEADEEFVEISVRVFYQMKDARRWLKGE